MIRWSFLKPRLAVLALAGVFLAFFLDSLARRALERAASRALGAKVTIGAVSFGIAGLALGGPVGGIVGALVGGLGAWALGKFFS